MKPPTFEITITPAKIEEWQRERALKLKQASILVQDAERLQARINAVSLFIEDDGEQQTSIPWSGQTGEDHTEAQDSVASHDIQPSHSRNGTESLKSMTPPNAIRIILRSVERPMTKDEIRERLRLADYDMLKFRHDGGYFHTIIGRMEKAGEVIFEGGRVKMRK